MIRSIPVPPRVVGDDGDAAVKKSSEFGNHRVRRREAQSMSVRQRSIFSRSKGCLVLLDQNKFAAPRPRRLRGGVGLVGKARGAAK